MRKIDGMKHIIPEPEGECVLCGEVEELRPYGPNGEKICYDCGMKDEESCRKAMIKIIEGPSEPSN